MLSDLRFAVRSLIKTPGFTAVAVFTLAVAIGACTTLFSVFEGTVLKPLPYANPDALVSIRGVAPSPGAERSRISLAKADFLRARGDIFRGIALFQEVAFALSAGTEPAVDVVGLQVSDNFLEVLGLAPLRGRFFSAEDSAEGAAATLVISDSFWKRRFNGDPNIVGRVVTLDRVPSRIIGVLPAPTGVAFGQQDTVFNTIDILVPWSAEVGTIPREVRKILPLYQAIARLAPGVSMQQASLKLDEAVQQFRKVFPFLPDATDGNALRTLEQQALGNLDRMFGMLGAVTAAVLFIACANVANLFLARSSARWSDTAVRMSLGAGRGAIARQFFAEAAVFSLAGAVLGILFSWEGVRVVVALTANRLPRADQVTMDPAVLGFSLVLSLLCAVVIASYPVWRSARADLQAELRQSSRAVAGGKATKLFRDALVVAQVQLSLMLLTCAGLLVVSFYKLQKTDPGFAVESRAFGYINLPASRYSTVAKTREFFQRLEDKLARAPELAAGGAVAGLPLTSSVPSMSYAAEDAPPVPPPERPSAPVRIVTPNYFRAMGIRLRAGRFFDETDGAGSQATAIVNERLAKGLFGNGSAIDKYLLTGNAVKGQGLRIVGVIRDIKSSGLAVSSGSEIYVPHAQVTVTFGAMTAVGQAKPGLRASAVIPVLRRVLSELDPQLTLSSAQTVDELVGQSIEVQRLTMLLLVCFSSIALLLAAVGIYSVLAYSVTQRTNEIGIRMALGAQRRQVVRLVLSQGMRLVAVGLVAGVAGAAVVTRLIRSMLYQVEPFDPIVTAGMVAFFALVAVLACLLPSLRASRIDPLVALRAE
jgi:predicted permease